MFQKSKIQQKLLTASCFLVSFGKQMTHSQSLAFPHIQHKEINILWNGCSLTKLILEIILAIIYHQ